MRAGVGTDNIDKTAATRWGIVVMNTPAGNTLSTAEHTIALMLALSRNVAPAYQSLLEGKWDRKSYMGTQVAGKTLGIVGLGRIGLAVAKRAKGLEMNVLGYDPFMTRERAAGAGHRTGGDRRRHAAADRLPHGPHAAQRRNPRPDRGGRNRQDEARHPARSTRPAAASTTKRRWSKGSSPASSAAWRSTCSPPSPARTARCSACRASSARPISAPAPKKPKRKSPPKRSSCSRPTSPPARSATR